MLSWTYGGFTARQGKCLLAREEDKEWSGKIEGSTYPVWRESEGWSGLRWDIYCCLFPGHHFHFAKRYIDKRISKLWKGNNLAIILLDFDKDRRSTTPLNISSTIRKILQYITSTSTRSYKARNLYQIFSYYQQSEDVVHTNPALVPLFDTLPILPQHRRLIFQQDKYQQHFVAITIYNIRRWPDVRWQTTEYAIWGEQMARDSEGGAEIEGEESSEQEVRSEEWVVTSDKWKRCIEDDEKMSFTRQVDGTAIEALMMAQLD